MSLPLFRELVVLSGKNKITKQERLRKRMLLFAIMADFMRCPGFIPFFSHMTFTNTTSRVRIILNNNISYNWTMPALAKEMALSVSTLKRKLKHEGKNFSSLLMKCRMERASELLINKKTTVKGVAFECGFKSASYFSTCFKKFYGFTPLEYVNNISLLHGY